MRRPERTALLVAIASLILAAGQFVTAGYTGSLSILALGVNYSIDTITSVAVLIGLRLSRRHTEQFPLGLYKLENVVATVIGVLILVGAYELARQGVQRLLQPASAVDRPYLILIVMPAVLLVESLMAWRLRLVAKEEKSPSLNARARDAIADMASGTAVLIAAAFETARIPYADGIAALIVVGFLAVAGARVTLDGLRVLLDASVEREVLEKVRWLVEKDARVKEVVNVEGRNSGSYRFLSVAVVLRTHNLDEAQRISHELEREIQREIANVDRVRIQFAVEKKEALVVAVPVREDWENLAPDISRAPGFAFIKISFKSGAFEGVDRLVNPFTHLERMIGLRVGEFLVRQGADAVLSNRDLEGTGPYYVLQTEGVEILHRPAVRTLEEAQRAAVEYSRTEAAAF